MSASFQIAGPTDQSKQPGQPYGVRTGVQQVSQDWLRLSVVSGKSVTMQTAGDKLISTILKHDTKVTSYKIALLRGINDIVLSFPDVHRQEKDVAVPLRMLAELWIAYYWPFVDAGQPILQGQRSDRDGQRRNDMSFRLPDPFTSEQESEKTRNCSGRCASIPNGFIRRT